MSWPVTNATRIHWTGHSWVAGQGAEPAGPLTETPGGFRAQYQAAPVSYAPQKAQAYVPAFLGAAPMPYGIATQTGRRDNLTYHGIGGAVIATLNTNYAIQTKAYAPDILVVVIGTNDIGGDLSPGGAYQTALNTYLDQFHADFAASKVLLCSITIRGEQWTAVGPHFTDGMDTSAINTRHQESAAARSAWCEYVDIIGAELTWTTVNNAPAPGITPAYPTLPNGLTYDNLHGSPACKVLFGTTVMQHLVFS